MTLDDGSGSLLELLRPKSAIARLAEPRAVEHPMLALGSGAILRVIEPAPAPRADRETLRTAARLDRKLRSWLSETTYAHWRGHLGAVATASWPRSAELRDSRAALLTPVAAGASDASLAWFLGAAALPARLQLTALIASGARRRRPRVLFGVDVYCDLCDQPQYAAGYELHALGGRALAELDVTPICRECLGRAARDPEVWERRRIRTAAARLRLIAGDRSVPGKRGDRGRFRVVGSD